MRDDLVKKESAVEKRTAPPAGVVQDFSKTFEFEEQDVVLGKSGAWTLDGQIAMAYGDGAMLIGRMANIAIIDPPTLKVQNENKENPFIEYDENGQPLVLWSRKIGVYIAPTGQIRYSDITDRIDIEAYLAERITLFTMGKETPVDSYVAATRDDVKEWNKVKRKPGEPVWWFIATANRDIGIAVNIAHNDRRVKQLLKDLLHNRKTMMRRFETSLKRRVIQALVPEMMTTTDFNAIKGEWNSYTMQEARFKVMTIKKGGFMMGIMHQIAFAIMEDNPEARQRALDLYHKMTGVEPVSMNIVSMQEQEYEELSDTKVVTGEVTELEGLPDLPTPLSFNKLRMYLKQNYDKFTDDQKTVIETVIGELNKDNANLARELIERFIANAPYNDLIDKNANESDLRGLILELITNETRAEKLNNMIIDAGYISNTPLEEISDEHLAVIYEKFTQ